jgi:hypothetical protein
MSNGYPKFAWIARVAEDRRLSDCRARILMYIANQNVHGGDDWFCVRQQTVADNLHVRRQTVGDALRCARECGLLELAAVRPRGTGWHQADTYRLILQSDVRGDGHNDVRGDGELGTPPPQSDVRGHGELGTFDGRQNGLPPATCDTLQGEVTGLSNYQDEYHQGVDNAARSVFDGVFGRDGYRVVPEQRALPAAIPVRYTPPLSDDERCPKHEIPHPDCAICRAFAHGRGEQL